MIDQHRCRRFRADSLSSQPSGISSPDIVRRPVADVRGAPPDAVHRPRDDLWELEGRRNCRPVIADRSLDGHVLDVEVVDGLAPTSARLRFIVQQPHTVK